MKASFIELGHDDRKAKKHILVSVSICAHDHILSRKWDVRNVRVPR